MAPPGGPVDNVDNVENGENLESAAVPEMGSGPAMAHSAGMSTKDEPNDEHTPEPGADNAETVNGWEARWQTGETPWDAGAPAPALVALLADGDAAIPNGRALVPGCGAGYDVAALASADREVVGLDIAPSVEARFTEVQQAAGVADRTSLFVGDFFGASLGAFDVLYDYTFLCALDPSQRPAWGARAAELVRPGGEVISLVFPMVDPPPGYEGPPWPLHPDDVASALGDRFELIDERDVTESHPGREGKERLLRFRRLP